MRARLIADIARRLAPTYALMAFFIIGLEWMGRLVARTGETLEFSNIPHLAAVGMAVAWFVAMTTQGHLQKRECVQLPVNRRDIWLCRWWLSVVFPGIVAGTAAAIGAPLSDTALGMRVTASSAFLIATCASAWSALRLVRRPQWMTFAALDRLPPRSTARRFLGIAVVVMVFGAILGGLFLPFSVAPMVIHAMSTASPTAVALMLVAAFLILSPLFHTPPVKERPPVPRAIRQQIAKAETAHTATTTSGVTGLRFMYWKAAQRHLFFFLLLLIGVVILWAVAESRTYSFAGTLGSYWLLPFDRRGSTIPVWLFTLIFIWFAGDDVHAEIRRLRTLPLSTRSLGNALLLRAALGPFLLWSVALLLHVLVLQSVPTTWYPGALLLAVGVCCLMTALSLAVSGSQAVRSSIFAGTMVASFALDRLAPSIRPSATVAGFILLASADQLCQWALQRRSRIYARRPSAAVPERFS